MTYLTPRILGEVCIGRARRPNRKYFLSKLVKVSVTTHLSYCQQIGHVYLLLIQVRNELNVKLLQVGLQVRNEGRTTGIGT